MADRLPSRKRTLRMLAVAYAFLVLAAVAFRGMLPGIVLGIIGVVVGVAIRRRSSEK